MHKKRKTIIETFEFHEKKLAHSLCDEIVSGMITLSVLLSLEKENFMIDTRTNALNIAVTKMKTSEVRITEIKRNLEKETLKFLSSKGEMVQKANSIQHKAENIEVISKTIGKSDKGVLKFEENLKKREEAHFQKLKQIESLEKQIQEKEEKILELEKKRNSTTPEKKKIFDNSFVIKENNVKQKEIELNNRSKILEEKKRQIEDYKLKIKWRLNNIQSLERKSEKLKLATDAKVLEFNNFIKTEEAQIQSWKEKNKTYAKNIESLREKCGRLEQEVKNKEIFIENEESKIEDSKKLFDSIEEFVYIEKNNEDLESIKFTDFAKNFQQRQLDRKIEYEEISKEKKILSEKLSSIINFH